MIRKFMLTLVLLLPLFVSQGQEKSAATDTASAEVSEQVSAGAEQQKVEMADVMRSEGKIYVVVGIILIVLAVMLVYLFSIDRHVKKLEKHLAEKGK